MGDSIKERAEVGGEFAREQGKGTLGVLAEAVTNIVTGRDGPDRQQPFHSVSDKVLNGNSEYVGESFKHLAIKSEITAEGPAYAPNPDIPGLPKEYETRVQVIQKFPEMKTVEETYYVKEVRSELRTVRIPRTRVVMEELEKVDLVPVLKQVPKVRMETVHRVVEEEREVTDMVPIVKQVPKIRMETVFRVVEEQREVTDMVPVVEMVSVPRIEKIPRVVTEEVEETVEVPTVIEVPKTRTFEVPTGNYCETETGTYVNPTHFNLVGKGHGALRRSGPGCSSSSSSSSSSGDEQVAHGAAGIDATGASRVQEGVAVAPGSGLTTAMVPAKQKKKRKGLLQRLEKKIVG